MDHEGTSQPHELLCIVKTKTVVVVVLVEPQQLNKASLDVKISINLQNKDR